MFVESFHGDIVNNRKNRINKPFSERLSIYIFLLSKFRVLTELVVNEYVGEGGGVNSTLFLWHQVWVPNTLGLRGLTLVSKQHDLLCKYISSFTTIYETTWRILQ